MSLILKVISYKGMPLVREMSAEFDLHGGLIGRNAANSLVLEDADKIVSGRHAEILYENGVYFVKDTSSNGTYLQNSRTSLNNAQAVLHNNEILRIGEYEILVEISSEAFHVNEQYGDGFFNSSPADPFADTSSSALLGGAHFSGLSSLSEQSPFGEQSHFAGQAPFGEQSPFTGKSAFAGELSFIDQSPMHDSFSLPKVMSVDDRPKDIAQYLEGLESLSALDNQVKTANSDVIFPLPGGPFASTSSPAVQHDHHGEVLAQPAVINQDFPKPQPALDIRSADSAVAFASPGRNAELLQQFLQGAGIKDTSFLPPDQAADVMKSLGGLFRNIVEGLMDVLRARAEMKSEFRVAVTTIRSLDNNPLKFNPDAESVLKLLMVPTNPAFIKPKDAVNEAFKDIKYHQIAVTAGIQASLTEIMHRFDPDQIEKAYEEGVVFQKKAKCWDLYCEKYPELKSLALEDFFGEEFANAYEKQMRLFGRH